MTLLLLLYDIIIVFHDFVLHDYRISWLVYSTIIVFHDYCISW